MPADTENFQINFDAFEAALNPNVQVVLINTPNNPSGAVYSADTLKRLAAILTAKQVEYGHDIFLISDEPYREIVFDGATQPYPASFYANSLTCYSWSKSLSLPGERIGYVAVNPTATDADLLVPMMGQISRGTGHNCPPSSIQLGVAKVIDQTADLNVYETNMNLLYDALTGIGFDVVRPGGTFYIFPKALEDDAVAFCMKAKEYDLILVPSDSFGVPGYFRMATASTRRRSSARSPCSKSSPTRCTACKHGPQVTNTRKGLPWNTPKTPIVANCCCTAPMTPIRSGPWSDPAGQRRAADAHGRPGRGPHGGRYAGRRGSGAGGHVDRAAGRAGDNGGDGLFAAAALAQEGANVTAIAVGRSLHEAGFASFVRAEQGAGA